MAIEAYSAKEHEADRLKASISWHLCFHMPKNMELSIYMQKSLGSHSLECRKSWSAQSEHINPLPFKSSVPKRWSVQSEHMMQKPDGGTHEHLKTNGITNLSENHT